MGVGDVLDAAVGAAGSTFGTEPLGPGPQTTAWAQRNGIYPPAEGGGSLVQTFNQTVIGGALGLGDLAVRGTAAIYRGTQAGLVEAGVHRDIVSIPDAFVGSPGMLGAGSGLARARAAGTAATEGDVVGATRAAAGDARATTAKPLCPNCRKVHGEELPAEPQPGTSAEPPGEVNARPTEPEARPADLHGDDAPTIPGRPSPGTTDASNIRTAADAAPEARVSDSTPTYRGDTRSMDEINAQGGFYGSNPDANISLEQHMYANRPNGSQWVSASTSETVAIDYATFPNANVRAGPQGGNVFEIQQPGGVDVGRTSIVRDGALAENPNREVAFPTGIQSSNISRYARVTPGTDELVWQPNPAYVAPQ